MNLFLWTLLAFLVEFSWAAPKKDLITDLPGLLFKPTFKQYSGYLNASKTSKLHYWFVESQNDPVKDPVVLWLNGGPGCSSVYGLLAENGPFRVTDDGRHLVEDLSAWNKNANVIYLESPAGVGYSYSLDPDFRTDDNKTAMENHEALRDFFQLFPEYADNDFFVTGESYAGVYIPTLVSLLLDDPDFKNLKGFAVGNGLSDQKQNFNTLFYYFQFHNMLPTTSWKELLEVCQCQKVTPLGGYCDFLEQKKKIKKCRPDLAVALSASVDPYNVYADCDKPIQERKHGFPILKKPGFHWDKFSQLEYTIGCANVTAVGVYMNLPETRKALHIPNKLPRWKVCGGPPYKGLYLTVKPQYEKALASKRLRILVYNGDFDSACNFLGGELFVDDLHQANPSVRSSWSYTTAKGEEIEGGFFKTFSSSNLTFTSVRGAGHMVPYDKSEAALAMINTFLQGKPFGSV